MKPTLQSLIQRSQESCQRSFAAEQVLSLQGIADEILKAFKAGRKILLCGNGGSAADAQHMAAEFIGRFKRERPSLPALALTADTSILTAVGNDYGFDRIFARQVEGLGQKGDVLIALSTSGNSRNVIEAVKQARSQGIVTVGFTGPSGGLLAETAEIIFKAQSPHTCHVQEIHMIALHAICDWIDESMTPA